MEAGYGRLEAKFLGSPRGKVTTAPNLALRKLLYSFLVIIKH